jgi:hypothetical protein
MRSAPTLKIWMTPLASVAMLEKLALLKMALCSAPVLTMGSSVWPRAAPGLALIGAPLVVLEVGIGFPNARVADDRRCATARNYWRSRATEASSCTGE